MVGQVRLTIKSWCCPALLLSHCRSPCATGTCTRPSPHKAPGAGKSWIAGPRSTLLCCWWPSPMWWVVGENTGLCVDVWYFQICFWFWEFPLCSHGDSRHGSGVASTWTRRHQQWVGLGNQTSASETTSTRIFMKKSSLSEPTPKPNTSEGKIIKQTSASLSMSLHLYKIGVTSGKNLATKYPYYHQQQ